MPSFGRAPQDGASSQDMSDERMAHILNESSHTMHSSMSRPDLEASNDADCSKSPSRLANCPSPFGPGKGDRDRSSSVLSSSAADSQNRRLKKYENDDIPQEKVVRIYQEELAKLMGRRVEDLRGPREFGAAR